jgi:hypothetical protein
MKTVHKSGVWMLAAVFLSPILWAQETRTSPQTPAVGAEQHKDSEKDKDIPVPPERPVATHHELALNGKTL